MCTKKERLLQKLNPTLLKMTPKLSGDAGSFIDLDSEDSLKDGAKKLMMRFLRNQDLCEKNRNSGQNEKEELTITSAKYDENEEICELITERLTLPFVRNNQNERSERPGGRLQKLKTELQEKMSAKWEEEYKKRISENKIFEKKHKQKKKKSYSQSSSDKGSEADDVDIAEKLNEVQSCDEGEEADDESEEEENKSGKANMWEGGNNDESNGSENIKGKIPEKDDECDDNEACSLVPAYQPGGGLLYGGSELTQTDEGLPQNLLSPSLKLSMSGSPVSKQLSESFSETTTPKKKPLFPNEDGDSFYMGNKKLFSQNHNNSFDLSDAFEFCSGKFPDADNLENENLLEGNSGARDNDDDNEYEDDEDDDNEFEEDVNGEEEQDLSEEASNKAEFPKDFPKTRKNIVTFEDSDEEEQEQMEVQEEKEKERTDEVDEMPSVLKLLSDDEDRAPEEDCAKSRKKNRKSLHFSDEEDAADDCASEKEDVDSVHDDGDESEKEEEEECDARSIHYDSEENEIINPKEFFEKEAELSGSEWSGDEDERGLDEFDAEEGDADNLDSNQVRSQLEKIHIRRVLDDDAREVRLIQEILFEDGDLHSDEKRRDRKFRWKNLGTFDEQGNDGESKEEAGNSSEDDCAEEEQQRKLRYEKELFLMTKKKNGEVSSDDEITGGFQMTKVTKVHVSQSSIGRLDKSKIITDSVQVVKNSLLLNARGSFLTRNEEFLSRLAKTTSNINDNVSGPKHSRNFVFATKSPEKMNSERNTACKRQVEDAESCGRQEKKMKVSPTPQVDTGPSILDLLV